MSIENSLNFARHPKCLNQSLKIFGFELFEIFILVCVFSLSNFILKNFSFGNLASWIFLILSSLALYFTNRGKPPGHLAHLIKFHLRPGRFSAFTYQKGDLNHHD